ncbi:SusC/RagA family TonB-linked outer membrane protein [Tannerella forsythia]|uniref:SusC/RagA family TonB-linked outer membrane protein n=1 Tax=Tannerella forsythia TaxID=28112 RepID=UPI00242A9D4F|nr:TonB-dependent receptor [Tannerella forsythia]
MKRKKFFGARGLLTLILCISALSLSAQTITVRGTVTDDGHEPVIGATVVVKGDPSKGTITDPDGNYVLDDVPSDGILTFSYVGLQPQDVRIEGRTTINVEMKSDTKLLDEVVVVGYGTTSKRKTTSAVSQVKADELAKVPVPNITQSLAGRAPGLIVQQSGGGVNTKASISIRGGGRPLYVIDGIICEERDFQNLNPEDIDQMSVLKDASATAVYGARAANGIILVKTKEGKAGRINVDYNFNYTLSQPAYLAEKLDSYTAALYVNRGLQYDGRAPQYTEKDLQLFRDGTDPQGHPNTDWHKLTMRTFSPETRHNLAVTGGTETMKIYAGLGYYNQESIYRTNANNMQRYNLRTNIEADIKSIGLKVISGIDAYIVNTVEPATTDGRGYYFTWSHIQNKRPMEAAYNPFGQIYSGTTDNPLVDISSDGGYYASKENTVRANLNLEWSLPWVTGLKMKAIGSYGVVNDRYKSWNKSALTYDWEGKPATPGKPNLKKEANHRDNFNVQLLADYARTFSEVHTIGTTLGMEASGRDYDNLEASRKNYLFDVDQMGAGPSSTMENGSGEGAGERRAAFIGRLKYDYASKYMVELNCRHDGSDYFPKGNRWGTFFSGSLAWMASDEWFWENLNLNRIFNLFKIRTSYGEIGQDFLDQNGDGVADRYTYLTSYGLNQRGAYIGSQWVPGFSEGSLVSPDMTWYTTKDFNIGWDFASLNSRLSGSVDYFAKITTGYLATPSNIGYTSPLGKNLPVVKSDGENIRRGFEFVLQWKDKIGDLYYGLSSNMTLYDERWNRNPNEAETSLKNPYKRNTQVGPNSGNLYRNLGYYRNYEDVLNSPKRNGSVNLMAGDLKYYDFNGDGKIDGDDQIRSGAGNKPRANFGFAADLSYKGFYMNMLWQGASNYNFYIASILQGGNSNYLPVIYKFQTDIWAPDNTEALYPRQHASAGYNGNNNFVGSDFWLVNAHYLRLKNMSIGYDFKHKWLKKTAWLSKCVLSLSGYNLLTFSPAKKHEFDPEAGEGTGYTYPVSRVYTVSLNIGF